MKRVVIFASGSGSNAENIINYFADSKEVEIALVLTNNPKAIVLDRCNRLKTPSLSFNRITFYETNIINKVLKELEVSLIVLAGFLWKFPESILKEFPNKVINIHPALLPKYGGKGMYGHYVHEAVIDNNESESGITIHYVNEHYDEGAIIFQAKCSLTKMDTTTTLTDKIHLLEMEHFPQVIEKLLM